MDEQPRLQFRPRGVMPPPRTQEQRAISAQAAHWVPPGPNTPRLGSGRVPPLPQVEDDDRPQPAAIVRVAAAAAVPLVDAGTNRLFTAWREVIAAVTKQLPPFPVADMAPDEATAAFRMWRIFQANVAHMPPSEVPLVRLQAMMPQLMRFVGTNPHGADMLLAWFRHLHTDTCASLGTTSPEGREFVFALWHTFAMQAVAAANVPHNPWGTGIFAAVIAAANGTRDMGRAVDHVQQLAAKDALIAWDEWLHCLQGCPPHLDVKAAELPCVVRYVHQTYVMHAILTHAHVRREACAWWRRVFDDATPPAVQRALVVEWHAYSKVC